MAYRKIDVASFIGKKYGRLTIVGRSRYKRKSAKGFAWDCICDCGKATQVLSEYLFHARTRSCGCLHDENSRRFREPGESCAWMLYKNYQTNARKRNLPFEITFEEFKRLTSQNCFYCGSPPSRVSTQQHCKTGFSNYTYNGVDRTDPTKGYVRGNTETCCFACNIMKWNLPKQVFLKHVALIYLRHKDEIDIGEVLSEKDLKKPFWGLTRNPLN